METMKLLDFDQCSFIYAAVVNLLHRSIRLAPNDKSFRTTGRSTYGQMRIRNAERTQGS